MTPEQLAILQHSLGLDRYGRGSMFRNHFVTGERSPNHPICMQLVALGYMTHHPKPQLCGGSDQFNVTKAGKKAAVEHSPKPPQLSPPIIEPSSEWAD